MKKILTAKELRKMGYSGLVIPGIILTLMVGIGGITKKVDYYKNKTIFPETGRVMMVEDGDTFEMKAGQRVRLLGVNAPERGKEKFNEAKIYLDGLVKDKKIWLEYDRYQDDKFGRILAWVWINCETEAPKFEMAKYMYINKSESKPFIEVKPIGCLKGELVNKLMVGQSLAAPVSYENRGRLKYRMERNMQNNKLLSLYLEEI